MKDGKPVSLLTSNILALQSETQMPLERWNRFSGSLVLMLNQLTRR